jgi:hypothetical protein
VVVTFVAGKERTQGFQTRTVLCPLQQIVHKRKGKEWGVGMLAIHMKINKKQLFEFLKLNIRKSKSKKYFVKN